MVNKLEHLAEFREILDNYHISNASKKILANTRLILLVGPSSAGRNTIIKALVKIGDYRYLVSDTTRRPRRNDGVLEKNGVEYWFRSEQDVLSDLRAGKFLEAALIHNQQVSGISLRELEQSQKAGKIAVNEIETVGAHKIMQTKPDSIVFFVVPPNFQVWMERMNGRGKMHETEKHRRMDSAVKEFEQALTREYYQYIVNDTFEHSVEQIHRIVNSGNRDFQLQQKGREVIEGLLVQTRLYLDNAQ